MPTPGIRPGRSVRHCAVSPAPAPDSSHILDYTTTALAYRLQPPQEVLILNGGAGEDLSHALSHGVARAVFVEPNAALLSLLRNELAGETGSLFFHPAAEIHQLEARSFLMGSDGAYGLILLPTISTSGGGAGLNAMQEQ